MKFLSQTIYLKLIYKPLLSTISSLKMNVQNCNSIDHVAALWRQHARSQAIATPQYYHRSRPFQDVRPRNCRLRHDTFWDGDDARWGKVPSYGLPERRVAGWVSDRGIEVTGLGRGSRRAGSRLTGEVIQVVKRLPAHHLLTPNGLVFYVLNSISFYYPVYRILLIIMI